MRLILAVVVTSIVAACASAQSGSQRVFVRSDGAREAQAALDADAIMQGMAQAREASQQVARDLLQIQPGAVPAPVTR